MQSLKEHLQKICGLPPRFRQKLLHAGEALEDDVALDSPIDVNLVILPLLSPTAEQANELTQAARNGLAFRVEEVLNLAQDPDAANIKGETPLCEAAKMGFTNVAELLLEAGADKDKDSRHSRHSFVGHGRLGVVSTQLTPLGLAREQYVCCWKRKPTCKRKALNVYPWLGQQQKDAPRSCAFCWVRGLT